MNLGKEAKTIDNMQNRSLSEKEKLKRYIRTQAKHKFFDYFGFLKIKPKNWFVKGSMDSVFLTLVIFILAFGLVMVFSSSYVLAMHDADCNYDTYYIIKRQAMFAAAGLAAMLIFSRINHKFIKEFSVLLLAVSVILLIVVLFYHTTLGGDRGGIKRYIELPGLGQFQPSEIAKLGLILFCAWGIERNRKQIEKNVMYLLPYIAVIAVMCVLVIAENHLSGTILIFCIGIAMLFLSGAKLRWFIIFGVPLFVFGVFTVFALWMAVNKPEEAAKFLPESIVKLGKANADTHYTMLRIIGWLDKDYDPLGVRWQTNNSLIAIGSGGFFGKGLGNSIQKHLYLSEAYNDFIFSIVCEELGFIGALAVMVLFSLLVWRGFVIANKAKDRFGSLLVLGIVFQVGLQAVIHMAVVTDTVPNTGIGLPFFSYGGTSLLILLAEMGMVLSVSRTAKMRK